MTTNLSTAAGPASREADGDCAATLARLAIATEVDEAPEAPLETHCSWVFLTSTRAFKLKKPRDLGFLNFTELSAREAACRAEIDVNRRFAPDLYLGLRPLLSTQDGRPALGPLLTEAAAPTPPELAGRVRDWLVEMRRFDPGTEADQLLAQGRLQARDVHALADTIAAAHAAAPRRRRPEAARRLAAACVSLERNLAGPAGLERAAAARWAEAARALIRRDAALIDRRGRHGFVRRAHGDLHLGNICLIDGVATPFDALEFDEKLATVDVLHDLAFAAADLLQAGRGDLAAAFLSRYLSATRDYGGLALWPLFLSLRAAVRAMASGLRGDGDAAAAKLAWAARVAVDGAARPPGRMILTAGLSGSGKSRLAAGLAGVLSVDPALSGGLGGATVVIASDVTRKRLYGRRPEETLPKSAYASEAHARVYARLRRDARRALAAGATVIVDSVSPAPAQRDAAVGVACGLGRPWTGFWLNLSDATRLERVARRAAAPEKDPSDAGPEVAAAQSTVEPALDATPGWRRLETNGPPESVLRAALAQLAADVDLGTARQPTKAFSYT